LRAWRSNFLAKRKEVIGLFEEEPSLKTRFGGADRFIRMWEYYLAGFEASFRYYGLAVFQIQLIRDLSAVPLTRDYMYEDKDEGASNWKVIAAAE
jgi:cyclopropane-fatty-acyl-phospholipid synthase